MSVSKPLWIRGRWEPPNVRAISPGGVPVDPRFLGGPKPHKGLASAVQVVPRIILGQEVEGNEGGIGFPVGTA